MAYTKVFLNGDPIPVEENLCAAAITPGHLIEMYSATVAKVRKQVTAGARCAKMFALPQILEGKEVTDAYSSGDRVPWAMAKPGDKVAAILLSGETVAFGTFVESGGAGRLRAVDADASAGDVIPDSTIGFALEEMTASGDTRCQIMII